MREFEARFVIPLAIIAISVIAVVTYVIERIDGVRAVRQNIWEGGWEVELAAGERSTPVIALSDACISFTLADMVDEGYAVEMRRPADTGDWRAIRTADIRLASQKTEYRFLASRSLTISGEHSRGSCGPRPPDYSFELYGSHTQAATDRKTFKIWRAAPLFVRFGYTEFPNRIRCIYHEKPGDVALVHITRRHDKERVLMFHTASPSPRDVVVWGSETECGGEPAAAPRREPPRATLGPPPAQPLRPDETESRLRLDPSERRELQQRLSLIGHDTNGVDGVFGAGTRAAIRNWQAARRFDPTGYFTEVQVRALRQSTEDVYRRFTERATTRQPAPRSLVQSGERQHYQNLVKPDR